MDAIWRLSSYISRGVYTVSAPFHPFGGAVDIIVVQQPDGSFRSSPWYVKFGKFQGVLKTKEKVVNISVNEVEAGFHMYLDHKGEAYFLKELDGEEGESVFSPLSSGDETDEQSHSGRTTRSKSYNFDANQSSASPIDVGNGKIVPRTNSHRSGILGLVFGRKTMKEDSRRGSGGVDMERAGSLERAEIAADLLEVKWSTNLSTIKPEMDNASTLFVPSGTVDMADKDLQVYDEQSPGSPLISDSMNKSSDFPLIHVENASCDNSESGFRNTESSGQVISPKFPGLKTRGQVMEISALEASDMEDRPEVTSATAINKFGVGDAVPEMAKGSVSEITIGDLHNPDLVELEVGRSAESDIEQASRKRDGLSNVSIPEEETGNVTVCSHIYSETSEVSRVGMNDSCEPAIKTLDFSCGGCEEVQPHAEVLYQTAELISEVNTQPESGLLTTTGNLNNTGFLIDGDSTEFLSTKTIHESEGTSVNSVASTVTKSLFTLDLHLVTSNSVETEVLVVNHQDTIIDCLTQKKNLGTSPVGVQSQMTDFSFSHLSENNEVGLGKPSVALESHIQVVGVDQILSSVGRGGAQNNHTSSHLSSSIHRVQEEENFGDENKMNGVCHSLEFDHGAHESVVHSIPVKAINSNIPESESLEADQLLFSDIDDLVPSGVQCKNSAYPESMKTENYLSLTLDGEDEHEKINTYNESTMSSDKLVEEYRASDFEDLPEKSRTQSSPISIPRIHKGAGESVRLVESLPNIRSHIDSLEGSDACHLLSYSLDSNSGNVKLGLLRKDVSSSLMSDEDIEHHVVQEHPRIGDTLTSGELQTASTNSAVELSLCKHLLYEGMGADSASHAFDSEKVDLEKFVSLGPALVKNDRLVVKIGGHYFPWDAAAPIILGMAAFGREQIFEPKGIIAVDQVEKTFEGDPSRAIVTSSGSWGLWPFSFRRSRTMSPALNGTNGFHAENAPDKTGDMITEKNIPKAKVPKMVRSIIPTSEQLASLNLKEGQNMITFTFSTPVLGKQQVDARIYLWKWNTRIVVSDVDGTITKSDVLGQFMPLVGKDWSQTGVAHLFSAIKENGYQLLFLSARAISQAYLTRQFLCNLKQEGKVLPDGPVVISPDGLFPSLFREVIRRAPHEFKIACLEDIRALFPPDCNPFYAGFGNRDTDEISYLKVGIPKGKIFIINPKGEVAVNRWVDTKSYRSLHALVNGMFPAMSSAEQEDFNSWNYWKMPLPDINI